MAPPPLPDPATAMTPMAPSVEKAYYRKCIELKRRLNEVEASNDEMKTQRVRLDRSIMKMRLERAFLLDELRKRMEYNVDGSEGSGDEGLTTPPPDRPHRDKRRRPEPARPTTQPAPPPAAASHPSQYPSQPSQPPLQRTPSQPEARRTSAVHSVALPVNSTDFSEGALYYYADGRPSEVGPPPPSGVAGPVMGTNSDSRDDLDRDAPIDRASGATGEALSAGPAIRQDSNGERRIASASSGGQNPPADSGGFTSVN